MWYDINKTLSYNCLFNFVVGPRGVGKTYSFKRKVINGFLKRGEQFIYLRRFESELKKSNIEKFFNDICVEFPDVEFGVKNGTFYIDGIEAGYYMPLSKAAQYKSVPFPKVDIIGFDEFIIDQGMIRYLPNEVQSFNEMYSTIARLRDVKVFFLSNAITFTNPYFLYFDLNLREGQKVLRKGDILLEVIDNPEYTEKAQDTRFGRLISGTEYGKYALENKFLRDTDTFIDKIPGASTCILVIRIDGINLGVYNSIDSMNWYVSENYDPTCKHIIAVDSESHKTDTSMAKESGATVWYQSLKQKYYRAEVRFTSIKAKNLAIKSFKSI